MKYVFLLSRAYWAALCTTWPPSGCDPNSCVNDLACGPSLKCLDSKCAVVNCDNFGDSACPSVEYRCLNGGCVISDFQCDKFGSKCLNSSMVCVGSTCISPELIGVGQTPTTTDSAEETRFSQPTIIPRPRNNLPQWTFYVFLPIGMLFICLYVVLSKNLHRQYTSSSRHVPRWIAAVFNRRGDNESDEDMIQPIRNFRLAPDYLVQAYLPPDSSDCTTIVQSAQSIRSFDYNDGQQNLDNEAIPNPEQPIQNPSASLILHFDNEDVRSVGDDMTQTSGSEPMSPRTIAPDDSVI